MISGKNIQLHSGTTLCGISGADSNYLRASSGASVVDPVLTKFKEFTISSGAVLINPIKPEEGACRFYIASGGTALHVNWDFLIGEYIDLQNGAYVEYYRDDLDFVIVSSGESTISEDTISTRHLIYTSGTVNLSSGAYVSQ